MKAEQIKQKAKPKKALFLINNNEVNTALCRKNVRCLDDYKYRRDIFSATEDDVYYVLTRLKQILE